MNEIIESGIRGALNAIEEQVKPHSGKIVVVSNHSDSVLIRVATEDQVTHYMVSVVEAPHLESTGT